ncbi:PGL/p-HBAD biosynthesis glycosyltransferase Rv2957/MT3031 [uncultured Clostridium sp.]|uniref:glycosyltransferase family 2 protein n=2 Tax=Diplocloster agilis TaxID=2850323 RepID=UPI000822A052|nr:glycosyltransferase family 2 protein [Diplocloster agilis]MBU9743039.1 glycosyltransferase [Diplocloster agilis]SCI32256.1 PGL/p-HBAD biosynthesis glycosyltransferase Rv2957/MT3031 [uncultured Clostridium sp.]
MMEHMNKPTVSVITTTYNNADNLRQTMEMILSQDYEQIQYVIVDGGSTDETLTLIREYEPRFGERLKWISEPDEGIYDAINKGYLLSDGDIIGYCFDRYADEHVISRMVDTIVREKTDGVHSDLIYLDGDKVVRKWHMGQGSIRTGWMPAHPTLYLKREVYEKYGLYKTDYKCSADYEYMIRCLKDGQVTLSYIPEVLIYMYYGGTSTNGLSSYLLSLKEGHRALKENGMAFAWVTDFLRIIRVCLQFLTKS